MSVTWRNTSLSLLRHAFFPKKLATNNKTTIHHDEDIWLWYHTTPLENSKGIMKHQRDPTLNGTIFDALLTDMHGNSNTTTVRKVSRVSSSKYITHRIVHRIILIHVSLCQCLRIAHCFYKQTIYGKIGLLLQVAIRISSALLQQRRNGVATTTNKLVDTISRAAAQAS